MKFILGTKIGMTQMFQEDGAVVPVTIFKIEPNTVVQVKTTEKDGYQAVQLGVGTKRKLNKAAKGHRKSLGDFAVLQEFKTVNSKLETVNFQVGDKLDVTLFVEGEKVRVTGISKGKGFQGVVKRHGFRGMPASHGAHSVLRHAGSIGQRFPQHTLKGMRMAGRMGGVQKTVRGLKIMKIDAENGILAIKGAVPGNKSSLVTIQAQ